MIGDAIRLVQDTIEHCEREGKEGMLLFCDQDGAYPRVEWDFLSNTKDTLKPPPPRSSVREFLQVQYDGGGGQVCSSRCDMMGGVIIPAGHAAK